MNSEMFVQLALEALSCSQKELAKRFGVSPTQISKWKKDEHMSLDMEEKFRSLLNIGDKNPAFVLWSGSIENAVKWETLIHYLAENALQEAETGYTTAPLLDENGLLCFETFSALREIGVTLPKEFPKDLDLDYDDTDNEDLWDKISENPYVATIYKIYKSLNDIYGFYAAYIADLIYDDELDLFDSPAYDIESCLLSLATSKTEDIPLPTPNFSQFKYRITEEYKEWITTVKEKAFRAGIPLRAELLGLAYNSAGELGHEAEAESLGFNSSRVHPDIYMNELLIGMRLIHQALPVIMKKLGIENEFELDTSELHLN
ncbi:MULTISPECIES: multiprotein-bridging factor 1 family protein [unclassified Pseudomonas]|uniref:helix-turn-helix domain-containing protein n=1 Tax=unclassified Pseudomonas TaxID=196821 RepID=UPI001A939FF2|nr:MULTISPECIES: helix-turn-helix transcriptional regulator [unclassified Pseudomonas]